MVTFDIVDHLFVGCGPHDKPKSKPSYLLLYVLCASGRGESVGCFCGVLWLLMVTFDVVDHLFVMVCGWVWSP